MQSTCCESKLDSFTTAFLAEDRVGIIGQTNSAASKQNTLAEGFKAMQTEGDALEHLDLVVEPLAGAVGTAVFPSVVKISAPMLDTPGKTFNLGNVGIAVLLNPVGQARLLENQLTFRIDPMEILHGVICFREIGKQLKHNSELFQPLGVIGISDTFLLQFAAQEAARRFFQDAVLLLILRVLHFALKSPANHLNRIVDKLNDMEQIDTDAGLRKKLLCDGNEAIVHVTAEVFDPRTLIG